MNRIGYKTIGVVLASVMFLATAAAALAAPPSPGGTAMIWGTVTVDDNTAVGYQVTAETDGESWSGTTDDTGQYVLEIPASYDTVDLYVAGTLVKSDVTVPSDGDDKRVDLSVSSAELTELPTADAGSDTSVDENSTVKFDGTGSSDPDGTIDSYSWTLGGVGGLENADTATPTYVAPADVSADTGVTVQLEVTDNAGATDTDNLTVTVQNVPAADNTPPSITDIVVSTGANTATVTFTTSESADATVTVSGTTETDANKTSHSITFSGLEAETSYTADITAEDGAGNSSTATSSFTTEAAVTVSDVFDAHRAGKTWQEVREVIRGLIW